MQTTRISSSRDYFTTEMQSAIRPSAIEMYAQFSLEFAAEVHRLPSYRLFYVQTAFPLDIFVLTKSYILHTSMK